ncbi:MAG: chemotaxis protein CheW [Paenibacillaceae bacterium]
MSEAISEVLVEEDTLKGKFLTFPLGTEDYGIEIKFVTEIVGIQAITPIPGIPEYIKGIINLRGKIIPVMDVRLRFKKEPKAYNDRTCIVVIDIKEVTIGLIVDSVSEVISISDENIISPPQVNKNFHNKFIESIAKIGNEVKLILDCDKLLNEEDLAEIEALT